MRINKVSWGIVLSALILSGCSSTDENKGNLLEEGENGIKDASTNGFSNGSSLAGEAFGNNGIALNGTENGELNKTQLGSEFSDPAHPLSKQVIYFMYDSSQIQQDFIPVVAAHAQYLLSHPARHIILGGHADERGSREYNIALGEQRAKSVYRMMRSHGVSDNQLEVVSYGEEKPIEEGLNEAAWQLNRRVEIAYQG